VSGSTIPDTARAQVRNRAHSRCERCGVPCPAGQWHHRRSRRVIDSHRHCPCNGVWLCHVCHRQVHRNNTAARTNGWVVSQWENTPGAIPVRTVWGLRFHTCRGTYEFSQLNN
jgi:5-methylcytosine-specific restriction enzyme A